jgi:serine/threonine-protein kinase
MTCNHCFRQAPTEAVYCPFCAAPLDVATLFAPIVPVAAVRKPNSHPSSARSSSTRGTTPNLKESDRAEHDGVVWLPIQEAATRGALDFTSGDRVLNDPDPGADFPPGTIVANRYRIVTLLGHGGMGDVYRADDLKLSQPVALKFLRAANARDPLVLMRFHAEVRTARQIGHPNVCRVYDIGEAEGRAFLSMEYIDGENLASLLRRIGRLPLDKAIEIALQICAGAAAAHDCGVLHRDLKPSNVMIDGRGMARLTDFGLAQLMGDLPMGGSQAGTLAYMAPEQLARGEISVQSDIFSLGLVLYETFTGQRPFEGARRDELQQQHEQSAPPRPSTLVDGLPPQIEKAILCCLRLDPAARPRSARQMAAALKTGPGGPKSAEGVLLSAGVPRPSRRRCSRDNVPVGEQGRGRQRPA